jgi:hypothetical protein
MVVAIMMKSYAVELFERIGNFAHGCSKTRVERNTLDLGGPNVHTVTLLDIAEVGRLNTCALMWHNRRLHVAKKCPLCGTEKWSRLDV